MSGTGHLDFQRVAEVLVWSLPQVVDLITEGFGMTGTEGFGFSEVPRPAIPEQA